MFHRVCVLYWRFQLTDIKAIIADDEEPGRIHLRTQLSNVWPELIICGEACNGLEAIQMIKEIKPNIAFLDIKMPGLSGIQVAQKILEDCRIVFVTAYDKYAIEAFDYEAIDYILKPSSYERLQKTVIRLKRQIDYKYEYQPKILETLEKIMTGMNEQNARYLRWIKKKSGDKIDLIPVDHVCYFKSEHKYINVVTKDQEFLIRNSISGLENELDLEIFWKIHRSTIINSNMIESISTSIKGSGVIKLKKRPELHTVSRSFAHIFKRL